jgi:hypothetical protein
MPGDFCHVREQTRLVPDVPERELRLGAGHCAGQSRHDPNEERLSEAAIREHCGGSVFTTRRGNHETHEKSEKKAEKKGAEVF